jgi:hypothetical protein
VPTAVVTKSWILASECGSPEVSSLVILRISPMLQSDEKLAVRQLRKAPIRLITRLRIRI